jgi:predicted nucleotidyltransferase
MTGPRGELAILPVGTQVVTTGDLRGEAGGVRVPRGAVGTVVHAPNDNHHAYRVQLVDGAEVSCKRHQLATLARTQDAGLAPQLGGSALFDRVILKVVIGSRAYGLHTDTSDTDVRGVYLPPADLHWSLFGVPEQIDDEAAQETYWELQKFCMLGLKANPNVLECLWSPLVESATPLGRELLALRQAFLSQLVFQTYSGYVASQLEKVAADLRRNGTPKWKHVMHLLRLLAAGVDVLATGEVPVDVGPLRERLLAVRRGEVAWAEIEAWRQDLHARFTAAAATTRLPERPDYQRVDAFLRRARRLALQEHLP